MTTLQVTVGNANAPQDEATEFVSEVLSNSVLHWITIDGQVYTGILPQPDYLFNSLEGKINITNENKFKLGQKIIFVYSKCQC